MPNWNPRRRENGAEEMFTGIKAENFPKLMTGKSQIWEAQKA